MKKFWVVLLTLGLIMAFAMPAAAVDVKFSGQYYAQGWYVDNPSLKDKDKTDGAGPAAFYSQRLRVQTEFKVAEGLALVTRFDALEKLWGSWNWRGGTGETQTRAQYPLSNSSSTLQSGARAQENIEFERVYLDFNTAIGKFQVGYQQFLMWGTDFLNTPLTAPGIRYIGSQGPMTWIAAIEKRRDAAASNQSGTTTSNIGKINDADQDVYDLGIIYKFKQGEAGLMFQYARNAMYKSTLAYGSANREYIQNLYLFLPYAKATFGSLFIEGEAVYGGGKYKQYESNATLAGEKDADVSAYGLFLHGRYDLKPFYAGLQFAWLSGDDPGKDDKVTGNVAAALSAGYGFDRCLILWNSVYGDVGLGGTTGAAFANVTTKSGTNVYNQFYMDNMWFYQLYAGVKPMPKLDVKAALSYAYADKKPRQTYGSPVSAANPEFVSDKYGTELDIVATYKIFDNLEYMIGAGYLWTGDFFKGTSDTNIIKNNYLITHKLTLNF